jgi:hypothetical protein
MLYSADDAVSIHFLDSRLPAGNIPVLSSQLPLLSNVLGLRA